MTTQKAYIQRETMISMAINGALSLVFFVLVFGKMNPIPTWGMGNWVFDFMPQSFMVSLMSTLVPGALTARRLKAGALAPAPNQSRLPASLLLRALLLAFGSSIVGGALIALVTALTGAENINWAPALGLKIAYGIILGGIVTPISLRAALRLHPTIPST